MNIDEFLAQVKTGSKNDRFGSQVRGYDDDSVGTSRKRQKIDTSDTVVKSGIMKKPASSSSQQQSQIVSKSNEKTDDKKTDFASTGDIEMSEEERLKILQMVQDEPEGTPFDESSLRRMVSVLEKKLSRNQEMRIKFPDQPEKFMESELELHEAIGELHALATDASLYSLAVDLSLPPTLLSLLSHENGDISCATLELLQELTDTDTMVESEEEESVFLDTLLEQQFLSLLVQNLERLDESNKDEADGVHNTLAIFENLFEIRPKLCATAAQQGLLQWLLKRVKARMPFDGNKLYVSEILSILLQETPENRLILGENDGIDILLQQLAAYKRHDPSSNEEGEFMENLFNCLCSALLTGLNRDKFLKGEGPQLMNLMLREKKQSRSGALKVLNHALSGPDGSSNANKVVDILGLRTLFPLFMSTPKRGKRKGLSASEHEEHILSILTALLQHLSPSNRTRLIAKFEENGFEKVERLLELHFKYLKRVNEVDEGMKEVEGMDEDLDEGEIYFKRLDGGLFTLQLIDYIILELSVAHEGIREKVESILLLRRASFDKIKEIVKEYGEDIGDENSAWKEKQTLNITSLLSRI